MHSNLAAMQHAALPAAANRSLASQHLYSLLCHLPFAAFACAVLPVESRCPAGAAYVSRYNQCIYYKALSIAANPNVEYSLFTDALTWSEAQTVCSSMGRGLVKLADATQDSQLYAAVTAFTGNQYW
jgi:hypothetical protein